MISCQLPLTWLKPDKHGRHERIWVGILLATITTLSIMYSSLRTLCLNFYLRNSKEWEVVATVAIYCPQRGHGCNSMAALGSTSLDTCHTPQQTVEMNPSHLWCVIQAALFLSFSQLSNKGRLSLTFRGNDLRESQKAKTVLSNNDKRNRNHFETVLESD